MDITPQGFLKEKCSINERRLTKMTTVLEVNSQGQVIICSLGEDLVKLSIELPRQRFWLTFMMENISGLIIKIPLI